jgi:chemotaxis family two-component system sensor histidine kinase/response regulator PixL
LGELARAISAAAASHPEPLILCQIVLADCQAAIADVVAGDREVGGKPSEALLKWTNGSNTADCFTTIAATNIDSEDIGFPGESSIASQFNLEELAAGSFSLESLAVNESEVGSFSLESLAVSEPAEVPFSLESLAIGEPAVIAAIDPVAEAGLPDLITENTPNSSADSSLELLFGQTGDIADREDLFAVETLTTSISPEEETAVSLEAAMAAFSPARMALTLTEKPITNLAEVVAALDRSTQLPTAADLAPLLPPPAKKRRQRSKQTAANTTPGLTVRVEMERLDLMNDRIGELALERYTLDTYADRLQATIERLRYNCEQFQELATKLQTQADGQLIQPITRVNSDSSDFDRLELDRYTDLHAQLEETIAQIAQIQERIDDLSVISRQSHVALERQQRAIVGLRDDLMWARMLPFQEIVANLPRSVRELSLQYGKSVDCELQGTNVLMDRSTIERLRDPMIHIVRNAFDHGIEPAEVRTAKGKPERGKIVVSASQQGSYTTIEVRDDGGGLNLDRIRAKAIERGLVDAATADRLTPSELTEFILQPNFSTAERVTALSGRGVGLDIVAEQLRAIQGSIKIDTVPNRGTTMTIRVPLALTLANLVLCMAGGTPYALIQDSIYAVVVPQPSQIDTLNNKTFFRWQNNLLPLYKLTDLLTYQVPLNPAAEADLLSATIPHPSDWLPPVAIIRDRQQWYAFQIDRLCGEQESTIKSLGNLIAAPKYIYGCTLLGDGTLVPVLNLHALLERATQSSDRPSRQAANQSAANIPTILVVDDSITIRDSLTTTLTKAGYRTIEAKDGKEALDTLQQGANIDLVISDLEMPNTNGFELLAAKRLDKDIAKIPTMIISSRNGEKHRKLASQLGAVDYFTKPYIDNDLIIAVDNLIKNN